MITKQDVVKVSQLSRLGMSEEEIARATQDLGNILEHFAVIQQTDTDGIPTSDDVTGLQNVTREDKARPEDLCSADALLEQAPQTHNRYVKVKAIFN